MRKVRLVGLAAVTAALLLLPSTSWAAEGTPPTEAPQARVQPPVGVTSNVRLQPPGGVAAEARLQPPVGVGSNVRLQPPVGFGELVLRWMLARIGVPLG